VFLETPQVTVINKQKFYIVKPKQGEDFTLPKKWSSKTSRLKYIGIMGTGYDVVDILRSPIYLVDSIIEH
ncbi:MAG: DNA topoisomerase III, partial [Streptococcus salivarius]